MRRRLAAFMLGLVLVVPSTAMAQAGIEGPWHGSLKVAGQELQFQVKFTPATDGLRATIDIPLQGTAGLQLANVRYEAPKVHFELPAGPGLAVFDGELTRDAIEGRFSQGGVDGTFALQRGLAVAPAPSPEPPVPYQQEEVKIQTPQVTLAGTLTLPPTPGRHAAVVLITGSGAQNRDEEIVGFRPFRLIADYLTRQGIAVLRCDDRGVGGSTGVTGEATSEDFANDVMSEIAFLKTRPDIDAARIGLLGHSEGGLVAPMVAARSRDVAFIVLMSGPGLKGEQILIAQAALIGKAAGATADQVERNARVQRRMFDTVRAGTGWEELKSWLQELARTQVSALPEAQRAAAEKGVPAVIDAEIAKVRNPWFRYFLDYDPASSLERVTCPVLAVFGELDLQVPPAENRQAIEKALAKGGNRRVTARVLPGVNHLYQSAKTGSPTEYATLPKEFAPGFLELVGGWISTTVGKS